MNKLLLFVCCLLVLACSKKNNDQENEPETEMVKVENERVVAWFPKDSLSQERMSSIADSIQHYIAASEKFIGQHDWQKFKTSKKINYYFNPGDFKSVADSDGDVHIPLWRIKSGKAPILHESNHVLLRTEKGNWNEVNKVKSFFSIPMWFTEGLAEYIAIKVAHENNLPNFDLQKNGGYLKVDSTCNAFLKTEEGKYGLDYIGEDGAMLKLFRSERAKYAPPFYTCSCSFTKFIGEKYGKDVVLKSNAAFKEEAETIEKLTKKDMDELKEEWLATLQKYN